MEDYIDILLTHLSEQRPFSSESETEVQSEARRATQALWETFSPQQRKLFLAYDRVAYSDNRFSGFRVTFDKDIRGRWDNITLKRDEDNELLDTGIENYNVMELKCEGAMPLEYVNLLRELGIHQVSFSKYGRIYTERFNNRERNVCYE